MFTGVSQKLIRELQLIQNSAPRVSTKTKKVDHITPVVRSSHWFPVCKNIDFKILLLVYKAINGFGRIYTSDLLLHDKRYRPLRSTRTGLHYVPRVKTKDGEAEFIFVLHISGTKSQRRKRSAATLNASLKTFLPQSFIKSKDF